MRNNDANVLLTAGVTLVVLGSLCSDVEVLGQLALLGTGSCLLFVACAMVAGVAVFERVMSKTLKFLEWFQRCLRG
jgi:hypothetical protein